MRAGDIDGKVDIVAADPVAADDSSVPPMLTLSTWILARKHPDVTIPKSYRIASSTMRPVLVSERTEESKTPSRTRECGTNQTLREFFSQLPHPLDPRSCSLPRSLNSPVPVIAHMQICIQERPETDKTRSISINQDSKRSGNHLDGNHTWTRPSSVVVKSVIQCSKQGHRPVYVRCPCWTLSVTY